MKLAVGPRASEVVTISGDRPRDTSVLGWREGLARLRAPRSIDSVRAVSFEAHASQMLLRDPNMLLVCARAHGGAIAASLEKDWQKVSVCMCCAVRTRGFSRPLLECTVKGAGFGKADALRDLGQAQACFQQ